jgi:hypothetical protein
MVILFQDRLEMSTEYLNIYDKFNELKFKFFLIKIVEFVTLLKLFYTLG